MHVRTKDSTWMDGRVCVICSMMAKAVFAINFLQLPLSAGLFHSSVAFGCASVPCVCKLVHSRYVTGYCPLQL